eukprot:scaffold724_cov156-Isochrysis_galbana.AAC.3
MACDVEGPATPSRGTCALEPARSVTSGRRAHPLPTACPVWAKRLASTIQLAADLRSRHRCQWPEPAGRD